MMTDINENNCAEAADIEMRSLGESSAAPRPGLPSKPVLEMALDLKLFKAEVKECLEADLIQDVEYVLLKVAMEVQDKANMLTMMQQ